MSITLIKIIKSLIKLFLNHKNPKQLAIALTLGLVYGFIPFNLIIILLITIILICFKINFSAFFTGLFLGKLISFGSDPLSHQIGAIFLIKNEMLKEMISKLYQFPLMPWLKINNTLSLGSYILGLTLCFPLYKLNTKLIKVGRHYFKEKWAQSKLYKTISASPWFQKIYKVYQWVE